MSSGARLWWVQHGSPQGIAQETAACTWPCETGRRCSGSGGIIVDSGSTVGESQQEAETIFSQSVCTSSSSSSSSSGSFNPGSSTGNFVPQPSNTGASSSSSGSNSGIFVPQPSNIGGSSNSNGNFGAGTTTGAASGSSANADGKLIERELLILNLIDISL